MGFASLTFLGTKPNAREARKINSRDWIWRTVFVFKFSPFSHFMWKGLLHIKWYSQSWIKGNKWKGGGHDIEKTPNTAVNCNFACIFATLTKWSTFKALSSFWLSYLLLISYDRNRVTAGFKRTISFISYKTLPPSPLQCRKQLFMLWVSQ